MGVARPTYRIEGTRGMPALFELTRRNFFGRWYLGHLLTARQRARRQRGHSVGAYFYMRSTHPHHVLRYMSGSSSAATPIPRAARYRS